MIVGAVAQAAVMAKTRNLDVDIWTLFERDLAGELPRREPT